MSAIIPSDKIYIAQSKLLNAGRGVFARINIQKRELIERCPVIVIPDHDAEQVNGTMLVTYIFYLGPKKDRLTLVLGNGSLYNHTDHPNTEYRDYPGEGIVEFVAIRDIRQDEEITVNYVQGVQEVTGPLWFMASP